MQIITKRKLRETILISGKIDFKLKKKKGYKRQIKDTMLIKGSM